MLFSHSLPLYTQSLPPSIWPTSSLSSLLRVFPLSRSPATSKTKLRINSLISLQARQQYHWRYCPRPVCYWGSWLYWFKWKVVWLAQGNNMLVGSLFLNWTHNNISSFRVLLTFCQSQRMLQSSYISICWNQGCPSCSSAMLNDCFIEKSPDRNECLVQIGPWSLVFVCPAFKSWVLSLTQVHLIWPTPGSCQARLITCGPSLANAASAILEPKEAQIRPKFN